MSPTSFPRADHAQADNDLPGSPLDNLLHRARAQGLLPAHAQAPSDEGRPWPVVLLTLLPMLVAVLAVAVLLPRRHL